jgi:hypothetical protein
MESEDLLPYSQDPATGHFPEPDKFSQQITILEHSFQYYPPTYA